MSPRAVMICSAILLFATAPFALGQGATADRAKLRVRLIEEFNASNATDSKKFFKTWTRQLPNEPFPQEIVLAQLRNKRDFIQLNCANALLDYPQESRKYFDEFHALLSSTDPFLVEVALNHYARFIYFDDLQDKIENDLVSILKNEHRRDVLLKTMEVCAEYGLRFDLVVGKAFDLATTPEFRTSDFYEVFFSDPFNSWSVEGELRNELFQRAVKEIQSVVRERREIAAVILRYVPLENDEKRRTLADLLPQIDRDLSVSIFEGRCFIVVSFDEPFLQLLQEDDVFEEMLETSEPDYPDIAAEFRAEKLAPSQDVMTRVRYRRRQGLPIDIPILEEEGHLPVGTMYYLHNRLLMRHPQLLELWKERHPESIELMDLILQLVREEDKQKHGGEDFFSPRSYYFYDHDYFETTILPVSELPFVRNLSNSTDRWLRQNGVDLLGHMGTPMIFYCYPGQTSSGIHQKFSFERRMKVEISYPHEAIDELTRLLEHPELETRIRALFHLVRAGEMPAKRSGLVKSILKESLERGHEPLEHKEALLIIPVLGPITDDLTDDVMRGIALQRLTWNPPKVRWSIAAGPEPPQWQMLGFEVREKMSRQSDRWLVDLTRMYLEDETDHEDAWDEECLAFLHRTESNSHQSAKLLWEYYLQHQPKKVSVESSENRQQYKQSISVLTAAVNLAPDPDEYIAEAARLARKELEAWQSEAFLVKDPGDIFAITSFARLLFKKEHWQHIPVEKYGPLLKQIARQFACADHLKFTHQVSLNNLTLPWFDHQGESNRLRELVILRQHCIETAFYEDWSLRIGTKNYLRFFELLENGDIRGEPYKPLLRRIVKSPLSWPEERESATLMLSVLEPDDPSHWNLIEEMHLIDEEYPTPHARLAALRQRRELALQAQKEVAGRSINPPRSKQARFVTGMTRAWFFLVRRSFAQEGNCFFICFDSRLFVRAAAFLCSRFLAAA